MQNTSIVVFYNSLLYRLLLAARIKNIRITRVHDGENGAVEELTAGSSKSGVITSVVMHLRLGKHGVVFDFRLAKVRAVGGDQDFLGLILSQSLDGGLVAQNELTGLHDQLQATVHGVLLFFL